MRVIPDDPSKRTPKEIQEYFWGKRPDGKYFNPDVKEIQETDVFSLGNIDYGECRFEIINMSMRLCECVVHKAKGFSHGFRLHPPHLWDIREGGKLFKKLDGVWVRFLPEPADRLEE